MEEDEVYSVARLLGDLVAYRASGTGHMELLAGLFKFSSVTHWPFSGLYTPHGVILKKVSNCAHDSCS